MVGLYIAYRIFRVIPIREKAEEILMYFYNISYNFRY